MKYLLTIFILLASLSASAGTYYIDYATGSDANPGTKVSPWKRAPSMNGFTGTYSHSAGDRLIFKGGVTWPNAAFQMHVTSGGSSTNVLDYYGVDTTWFSGGSWTRPLFDFQSTIIGTGNGNASAGVYFDAASFIMFDSIELANLRSVPAAVGPFSILFNSTQNWVIVTNCVVRDWAMTSLSPGQDSVDMGGIGKVTGNSSNLVVTGCLIHQDNTAMKVGCAIRNMDQAINTEVRNTTQGFLGGNTTAIVQNCNIHDFSVRSDPNSHCNAIEVFQSITASGNLIHDLADFVSPCTVQPHTGSDTNYVFNNIFWNCGQNPIQAQDSTSQSYWYIWNNTIDYDGWCIRTTGTSPNTVQLRNNQFLSLQNPAYSITATSLTDDHNLTMTPSGGAVLGYTVANQFAPVSVTSPTVGKGATIPQVTTDIRGNARTTPYDIGAYQFTSAGGSPGTITWSVSDYPTTETSGTVVVTAVRSGGTTGTVTANYATSNGTATAGHDYSSVSGQFSWADGASGARSAAVFILNSGDTATTNRVFNVTLSGVTGGATITGRNPATVTISMTRPTGTVQWSTSPYGTTENSGSVTLTATRVGGTNGAISIPYTTVNGSAVAGHDYTATSGTLSFADGSAASVNVSVPILFSGDTALTNRSFTVVMSGAPLGTPSTATVNITMNPPQPTGNLQIFASPVNTTEASASVAVIVQRFGGSSGAVGVSFATANGTAIAGHDYNAQSGTLTWANGDAGNKSIVITQINSGDTSNTSRQFIVSLSQPTGGAGLGNATAVVVIAMTPPPASSGGQLGFSASSYATASTAGSVTITVNALGSTNTARTVHYSTTPGTALPGTDYTSTSGTLSWASNDNTSKTFAVPLINPGAVGGGPRSFTVKLDTPTGGANLAVAQAAVSITETPITGVQINLKLSGSNIIGGSVRFN